MLTTMTLVPQVADAVNIPVIAAVVLVMDVVLPLRLCLVRLVHKWVQDF